jgi:hypothetical protein
LVVEEEEEDDEEGGKGGRERERWSWKGREPCLRAWRSSSRRSQCGRDQVVGERVAVLVNSFVAMVVVVVLVVGGRVKG